MEEVKKHTDDGVNLIIRVIENNILGAKSIFANDNVNINNALRLFNKDQLISCIDDNAFHYYALLSDGRLLCFSYYGTNLSDVEVSIINKSNYTVKTVRFNEQPEARYIQIFNEQGVAVTGPLCASDYLLHDINKPIQEVIRPVNIEQLKRKSIKINRDDLVNDVVYDLVTLLQNGEKNSEINDHDENMEQAGIFKIFDEDQVVYTKSEFGVETCWSVFNGDVIRIVCVPPVSNDGRNAYYMALYHDASKYTVTPTLCENERTSIQITYDKVAKLHSDEELTYLEIPEDIKEEKTLSEIVRPITFEQILERAQKTIEK